MSNILMQMQIFYNFYIFFTVHLVYIVSDCRVGFWRGHDFAYLCHHYGGDGHHYHRGGWLKGIINACLALPGQEGSFHAIMLQSKRKIMVWGFFFSRSESDH